MQPCNKRISCLLVKQCYVFSKPVLHFINVQNCRQHYKDDILNTDSGKYLLLCWKDGAIIKGISDHAWLTKLKMHEPVKEQLLLSICTKYIACA